MKNKTYLILILFIIAGFLVISCTVGGSDADDDDDDNDEEGFLCDSNCFKDFITGFTECWKALFDCGESGATSDPEQCYDELSDCGESVLLRERECANNCNSCLKAWYDCQDACPQGDEECLDKCDEEAEKCATWLDYECSDACFEIIDALGQECSLYNENINYDFCRSKFDEFKDCAMSCIKF